MSKPVTVKNTTKKKLLLNDKTPPPVLPIEFLDPIVDPCAEINLQIAQIDTDMKVLTDKKKMLVKECNDLKYISWEEQPKTLIALLKYIFFHKIKTYDDLIIRFPDSKERMGNLYTKNYIFEALWKIVFLLKFDNLVPNTYKRIYKASLENERLGKDGNVLSEYKYLADSGGIEKINSGSKSGICDFYFTIEKIDEKEKGKKREKKDTADPNKVLWACEESLFIPEPKQAYMFTSKLYNKTKSIQDYDYENILVEAQEVYKDKTKWNIVSLVRNAEELRKVILGGGDKAIKAYADSNLIFDEADLRNIYYPTLYKWLITKFGEEPNNIEKKKDWERLLDNIEQVFKISDNLRFHQRYVVDYTIKVIEDNLRKQEETGEKYNPGRFIWGAVARSGKSYMVGGLVAKLKPQSQVVILILGAVNETKSQFIGDLFQKYTDLQDYQVIDLQENSDVTEVDRNYDPVKNKYVVVISQESLRAKIFKDICLSNPKTPTTACEDVFIENCNKGKLSEEFCKDHENRIDNEHPAYNPKYVKKNETFKKNMFKKSKKVTLKTKQPKAKQTKVKQTKQTKQTKVKGENVEVTLIEGTLADIIESAHLTEEEEDEDEAESDVIAYNGDQINFIKKLLREKNKIIFFDEIHQGGGSDSLQEQTIKFFYDEQYPNPLLIMVTATYSKPLGKYGKNIDGNESVLILWSYEMIMLMKTFTLDYVTYDKNTYTTDTSSTYLIDKNDAQFEAKMDLLFAITTELNDGGVSCETIAQTYEKNPELVYLLPTIKETDLTIEVAEGVEINIQHKLKNILEITKRTNKFKYEMGVNKLLTYIYTHVYDNLLNKTYGFVADGQGQVHTQLWFLPTSMKNTEGDKNEVVDDKSIIGPMTYQLATAIINHPKFKNFNVCVIHGTTTKFDNNYADLNSKADLEEDPKAEPRKVFFKCIKDKDVKVCIRLKEKESKRNEKSLIILTGQRLRLGISLPCADVAIHMDPINAYDIIYQSMFRVLTERPGKKQGFFVDMVLDRAIKFFYKYTNMQQKFSKISGDSDPEVIEEERERVRKNLLLFDVGSIRKSLGFSSSSAPVNSYNHIAETFKIRSDEEFNKEKKAIFENKKDEDYEAPEKNVKPPVEKKIKTSSEVIEKNKVDIVKFLENLYTDPGSRIDLEELMKNIKKNYSAAEKQKMEERETKKEEKQEAARAKAFNENVGLENDAEQAANKEFLDAEEIAKKKEEVDSLKENFKNITEQIQNTFSLYILFNTNITLADILKDNDVLTSEQISNIKQCTDDDILYYCYLLVSGDDIDDISDENIQQIINNHLDIIRFLNHKEEYGKNHIKTLFDNIKDEMKPLNEKIKSEANAYKDTSIKNAQQFCPAIYSGQQKSVLEIIRQYLTPKSTEKNLFGEVFTPIELVCEMLSLLPMEVWTNPYLLWLDPANGIGNFPIIIYFKLMVTLQEFKDDTLDLTDEGVRSKHIIENMLYMNELNPINVAICIKIFNMIDSDAKPHVNKGNFLTELVYPTIKFDIIVGNPPFQTKKEDNRKSQPLWNKFVLNIFDNNYLKENGYLLFIHPSGWRSPTGDFRDVFDKIIGKNLKYLSMNDFNRGKEVFNIGTNFDYYVLENKPNENNITKLVDIHNNNYELNLKNWKFIPSGSFIEYEQILATSGEASVDVLYDRTLYGTDKANMSKIQTDKYKYPCVYTITQKDGINLFYSSIKQINIENPKNNKPSNKKHIQNMFVPKVIWSNGLGTYPVIDREGIYGLTQDAYAIVDDVNNLDNIEKALNNKRFIELMKYVKFENNKYNFKVIKLFKKNFYEHFLDE